MNDMEIARSKLYDENLTLVIVKNDLVLYSTKSHRISGFLDAIEKLGSQLEGSSIADRVAGKAIALLSAYAKINVVYAAVLSHKAMEVFQASQIEVYFMELTENILDVNKSGICPFEKKAADLSDPKIAYQTFKNLLGTLRAGKS